MSDFWDRIVHLFLQCVLTNKLQVWSVSVQLVIKYLGLIALCYVLLLAYILWFEYHVWLTKKPQYLLSQYCFVSINWNQILGLWLREFGKQLKQVLSNTINTKQWKERSKCKENVKFVPEQQSQTGEGREWQCSDKSHTHCPLFTKTDQWQLFVHQNWPPVTIMQ